MALVFLGLGSNLGDRLANLKAARQGLADLPETVLLKDAGIYETEAVGGPPGQDPFYNSASVVDTSLEPLDMLREIQAVERRVGRRRESEGVRWGPRVIDIDILLWDDQLMDYPQLVVPHPHLARRGFALAPLAELDRERLHPALEMTIQELLERIDLENEGVRRISL